MFTQPTRRYTLEEYFDLEMHSEERFEYFGGRVFDLSGDGSIAHIHIVSNLLFVIGSVARIRDCRANTSHLRVKVPAAPPYRYPDLTTTCAEPVYETIGGTDALTNPELIVEVLSASTEAYDRGDKFTEYKSIESFREYLLVAQHRPHITHYVKDADGHWSYEEINGIDESLRIATLDCELRLRDVYENVEFIPQPKPPLGQR